VYVNLPALKPQANPIIKLLNKKYVPKESVKPGIEAAKPKSMKVSSILKCSGHYFGYQLVELKNILLAHADPNVPEVNLYLDILIHLSDNLMKLKE